MFFQHDSKAKIPIFKTVLLSMKFLFYKIISCVYFLTKGVGDFNVNLSTWLTQKGGYSPPPFFVSSNSNSNELLSVNSSYSYSAAAALRCCFYLKITLIDSDPPPILILLNSCCIVQSNF